MQISAPIFFHFKIFQVRCLFFLYFLSFSDLDVRAPNTLYTKAQKCGL